MTWMSPAPCAFMAYFLRSIPIGPLSSAQVPRCLMRDVRPRGQSALTVRSNHEWRRPATSAPAVPTSPCGTVDGLECFR